MAEPARVDGRFLLRGSIDLVERKPRTTIVRVTDHKTGKNRTTLATIVDGGRVLQPVLYGLALESLTGRITMVDMRTMNHAVDATGADPAVVAREFLSRVR